MMGNVRSSSARSSGTKKGVSDTSTSSQPGKSCISCSDPDAAADSNGQTLPAIQEGKVATHSSLSCLESVMSY